MTKQELSRSSFGAIMAALALAVMGARKLSPPTDEAPTSATDPASNGTHAVSTNDLVDWCTSAAAPVVASIHSFTASPLAAAATGGDE